MRTILIPDQLGRLVPRFNPDRPRFAAIPQFIQNGNYQVDVSWKDLEWQLKRYIDDGLQLDPDFQRAHVWTDEQRTKYVEFMLQGGNSSRTILFNCPGFTFGARTAEFVLVDGKQRIEAARKFLRNEIPAFGCLFKQFVDQMSLLRPSFVFAVNELATRADVLKWYLQLNNGGVVHSQDEIEKVKAMLEMELRNGSSEKTK